jgi:hypothetical protein
MQWILDFKINGFFHFATNNGPCHVSGIFLPLRVNSLHLATIYEVKIPLRKWKKSLLQRNPAQMTWHNDLKSHLSGLTQFCNDSTTTLKGANLV